MYAFLLVLGGVIAAAGLTLVSSGVSIQNHTFDATNVTPGTIAITGGCILAGLGFVIRALMRVERALTVRPMPRPPRLGDSADAATSAVPSGEPGRLGVPPKPAAVAAAATEPSAAPAAFVPSSVAQTGAPERLRVAPLERLEGTSVAEVNEASLLPKVAVVPKEEADEISAAAAYAHQWVRSRADCAASGGERSPCATGTAAIEKRRVRFTMAEGPAVRDSFGAGRESPAAQSGHSGNFGASGGRQ